MDFAEIVGYIASFFAGFSLMMGNILYLRWLNLVGATLFCWYGLMIEAYPVLVLNLFITGADIYYIYKIYSDKLGKT
ncbi:MAG: membrane protein [Melioribacteraceae bacterium]|nr:MAG: membrane protein [Melioribacteraceae bacterium]